MSTATETAINGGAKMSEQVDLSTIPISPDGVDVAAETESDGKNITVFHDKDNFNVIHPLAHKWTLWFTKPPTGKVSWAAGD